MRLESLIYAPKQSESPGGELTHLLRLPFVVGFLQKHMESTECLKQIGRV